MQQVAAAGSGKTLISVLLIQDKAHELQRAQKKITVFLAPRVSLVHQVRNLPLEGARTTGERLAKGRKVFKICIQSFFASK